MPAFSDTFPISKGEWQLVTPNTVPALCLQCQGPNEVHIKVNQSSTVPPTNTKGSKRLDAGGAITTADPLIELFPSSVDVSGNGFVWAYTAGLASSVSVDYNA